MISGAFLPNRPPDGKAKMRRIFDQAITRRPNTMITEDVCTSAMVRNSQIACIRVVMPPQTRVFTHRFKLAELRDFLGREDQAGQIEKMIAQREKQTCPSRSCWICFGGLVSAPDGASVPKSRQIELHVSVGEVGFKANGRTRAAICRPSTGRADVADPKGGM